MNARRNTRRSKRQGFAKSRLRIAKKISDFFVSFLKLFVITKDARLPAFALLLWFAFRLSGFAAPISYTHEYLIWALFAAWFFGSAYGARKIHLAFALVCSFYILLFCAWDVGAAPQARIWSAGPSYARVPAPQGGQKMEEILPGSEVFVSLPKGDSSVDVFFGDVRKTIQGPRAQETLLTLKAPSSAYKHPIRLLLRAGLALQGRRHFMLVPDHRPSISFASVPVLTTRKTTRFSYKASDDFGLKERGVRVFSPQEKGVFSDLPFEAFTAKEIEETRSVDFTSLPWQGQEVRFVLYARDGAGQESFSKEEKIKIPERHFQNPFARALIEEREKIKDKISEQKLEEAANIMAGLARQQGLFGGDPVVTLALRAAAVRLILNEDPDAVSETRRLMWRVAVRLDEGKIGLARAALAKAENNLASALRQKAEEAPVQIFQGRLHQALEDYLAAVQKEMARQPEALQAIAWPLATRYGVLTPEDLQAHLLTVDAYLKKGKKSEALTELAALHEQIEDLRTTPPELTKEQFSLLEQTAALSKMVDILKNISEVTEKLLLEQPEPKEGKKVWNEKVLNLAGKQEDLRSMLAEMTRNIYQPARLDAVSCEKALRRANDSLKRGQLFIAQQAQAEALGLLENSLLALSDQTRAAMTSVPE